MNFHKQLTNNGFSLLELMIYIGISAGLLTYGLFQFQGFSDSFKLRTTSSEIKALISSSQQKALLQGLANSLLITKKNIKESKQTLLSFDSHTFALAKFGQLHKSTNTFTAHPGGAVSPGTILLKRNNRACSIRVALRGAISEECH